MDRFGSGNAPVNEGGCQPALALVLRTVHLNLCPGGAAGPGHINGRYACLGQQGSVNRRETPADLFRNYRYRQSFANCFDLFQQPGKAAISFGLDGFLQGVEVQDERIRLNHLDGPAAFIHPVAIVELDGAQVGEQQDAWRN